MKCFSCGKVLKKGTNFCPECGADLTNNEENQTSLEDLKTNDIVEKTKEEKLSVNEEIKDKDNRPKKTDKLGIAGFVLGLCGLCFTSVVMSIIAIVFSSVSKSGYDETKHKNKGFAIAGLVLGIVGLVASIIEAVVRKNFPF